MKALNARKEFSDNPISEETTTNGVQNNTRFPTTPPTTNL